MADLTAFEIVAEAKNFTRRATKLGLSRSALSQIVRRLEARLGVRLREKTDDWCRANLRSSLTRSAQFKCSQKLLAIVQIAERLPGSPLSRNQVELMAIDTVASPRMLGCETLGITPHPLERTLEQILTNG